MATNFPTSLDNFTNPVSGNTLDSPSHSLQHSDANDAIEAIEAKLGVGASPAGSATSGYVLMAGTGGTTTWSVIPTQGLVQVVPSSVSVGSGSGSVNSNGAITFSGASSVSINDVFSSTYDNYRIVLNVKGSTNLAIQMRYRVSGSDDTASSYLYGRMGIDNNGTTNNTSTGASSFSNICNTSTNYFGALDFTCFFPNKTERTTMSGTGTGLRTDYTASAFYAFGGLFDVNTSFTGFSLIASTGNITGFVSIYGYRD